MGLFHDFRGYGSGKQLAEPDPAMRTDDDAIDVTLVGVFDDFFRNLPHEERTVIDAFREVGVQIMFDLLQQGLGGGDPVGLALAGKVVGFIDRFGREHVHD